MNYVHTSRSRRVAPDDVTCASPRAVLGLRVIGRGAWRASRMDPNLLLHDLVPLRVLGHQRGDARIHVRWAGAPSAAAVARARPGSADVPLRHWFRPDGDDRSAGDP